MNKEFDSRYFQDLSDPADIIGLPELERRERVLLEMMGWKEVFPTWIVKENEVEE